MQRTEINATRRTILATLGSLATGVVGGAGPVPEANQSGDASIDSNAVTMPGEIATVYYYPTYSEFESAVGTPDRYPVLLVKDSGIEVIEE